MTRTMFLIVISFVLIAAGSLNAFEVKFTPQSATPDYKAPVTSKMPTFEPADKIIVKEPLKIPDEVMTKPLPVYQPKYQPEPVAPIVEAEESGSGQGSAQNTPDPPASGAAEQGNAEESMPATPAGQPMRTGPSQALQGVQTPATQLSDATEPAAGGCGRFGILTENIGVQDPGAAEAPYPQNANEYPMNSNEYPPSEYYYDEQPIGQGAGAQTSRPPGIYFHDEEKQQEDPEGEAEE